MIAILIAWLGGFLAARHIHRIWHAAALSLAAGVLSALTGTALRYFLGHDVFSEKELVVGLFLGLIGYPLVSLTALWVHRRRTAPLADQPAIKPTPAQNLHLVKRRLTELGGWSRIFVAISAIWILGVSFFAYRDLSRLNSEKSYQIAYYGDPVATYVFSARQPEPEVKEIIDTTLIPDVAENAEAFRGRVIRDHYEGYVASHRPQLITDFAQLALIPVFAFALGTWLFLWVRRGFASSGQT